MAEKFIEEILAENVPKDVDFNRWLLMKFKDPQATCSIEDFAVFYLGLVKTQTDEFVKYNTSNCNTPRKMTLSNIYDNIGDQITFPVENLNTNLQKEPPKVIATKRQPSRELFIKHDHFNSMESPQCLGKSLPVDSSTPVGSAKLNRSIDGTPNNTSTPQSFRNTKNSFTLNDQSSLTQRNSSRNSLDLSSRNSSMNRRNMGSPLCLGDFLNTSTSSNSSKNKKKNSSLQQSFEQTPKFSNNDFPSLGGDPPSDSKLQPKKSDSKPKKRVVPITISRKSTPGASNFISSSFQEENNLLNLPSEEGVDILCERRMLKDQREAISKDFTNEMEPQRNLHAMIKENLPTIAQSPRKNLTPFEFDESKVEHKELLLLMARIYSFILDMNLVPNILSEFSYLFNVLNTEYEPVDQTLSQSVNKNPFELAANLLKSLHNCVHFIVHIIKCQRQNLELLDVMTLRVVVDNERIQQLAADLNNHLKLKIHEKSQLDTSNKFNASSGNSVSQVVLFQQETDNRDNFPSDKEFGAFKKQRDLFYGILRTWEFNHLDQTYDFRKDLGYKIRSLITQMEHPINMAHLAKLFTAQLIISCNFDNPANELQLDLPNIDLSKLSKLRQRLVAPSQFSTQYLFPGNQAFFRDFIICCDQHMIFMEQLKISLVHELMQMNDSSMETLSITSGNEDENKEKSFREEFTVRPETMTTMRVLAKFIGFVISRPYTFDGYRNSLVDQKQSQIRNSVSGLEIKCRPSLTNSTFSCKFPFSVFFPQLHPDFDVKQVVLRAIDGRKLLVTIPWLVEYLAMLDFITIRLDYYRELFQLLFTIYMKVNVVSASESLSTTPTSKFIIRTCLGWLFEHPEIPEEYSNNRDSKLALKEICDDSETKEKSQELNPHLEGVINAACPFLADFRVSMMPQKTTKALSRTGRYRHITTKFQDKSSTQQPKVKDNRERLIEAFLASQSLSVRKIVDFTIDRVSSAAVKDFQVKHLVAIRKEAKAEVETLVPSVDSAESLVKKMIAVYQQHLKRLQNLWINDVKKNCATRVQGTFDSLLPIEMLPDVKRTLINITMAKTFDKTQEWCATNLSTIEIFSRDIQVDATKFIESKEQSENKQSTSNIVIDLSAKTMPSDYFKVLQELLHKASLHADKIESSDLINSVDMAIEVVTKQTLPQNAYRNIAFYMLQLALQCIISRSDLITREFLEKLYSLWRIEKLTIYTSEPDVPDQTRRTTRRKVEDFIFTNVINARLLVVMQGKCRRTFEAYGDFIIDLVKEKFITIESINEQSVRLYKIEWPKESLNDIAFLIHYVKSSLPSEAVVSPESVLFMELVVDLARDMENF